MPCPYKKCIYRHRKKSVRYGKKYDKIKCYTTELRKNLKSEILWATEYEDKYTILLKIIFISSGSTLKRLCAFSSLENRIFTCTVECTDWIS